MTRMATSDASRVRARAEERARAAATMSGVSVRELTEHAEHIDAERLMGEIWRGEPPIPRTVLRMLSSIGGYVAGAYRGGELVGVSVGFVAAPAGAAKWHLHSHVAGIAPQYRGHNVGWAMKLHQRAWALEHGLETISWTFDPLVRRNAFFNLTKLGADASFYLSDFYGEMTDVINLDQGSERPRSRSVTTEDRKSTPSTTGRGWSCASCPRTSRRCGSPMRSWRGPGGSRYDVS
jgi:hypothetical protein